MGKVATVKSYIEKQTELLDFTVYSAYCHLQMATVLSSVPLFLFLNASWLFKEWPYCTFDTEYSKACLHVPSIWNTMQCRYILETFTRKQPNFKKHHKCRNRTFQLSFVGYNCSLSHQLLANGWKLVDCKQPGGCYSKVLFQLLYCKVLDFQVWLLNSMPEYHMVRSDIMIHTVVTNIKMQIDELSLKTFTVDNFMFEVKLDFSIWNSISLLQYSAAMHTMACILSSLQCQVACLVTVLVIVVHVQCSNVQFNSTCLQFKDLGIVFSNSFWIW